MKNIKQSLLSRLVSYLWITVGCVIYALGFVCFFAPNDIASGGVTGIAQVIHALFPPVGVGTMVLILNVPLFLAGWRVLGGGSLLSSLYAMAVVSVLIDVFTALVPVSPREPLLAALYGGTLMGVSLGLVLRQGSSTGGTDLAAQLLRRRFSWIPTGQLLMVLDFVIIACAALVFHKLDSALYGVVALVVSTVVIDKVLVGLDTAKVAYIISNHPDDIAAAIIRKMDRGVTILHGTGGYSGDPKKVLMCAFRQKQIVPLKRIVKETDPAAFLVVCQTTEVLGEGFREHDDTP